MIVESIIEYETIEDIFIYGNVTTKIPIEDIPVGTKFDSAVLDVENDFLIFYDEFGSELRKFKVGLKVLHEVAVSG